MVACYTRGFDFGTYDISFFNTKKANKYTDEQIKKLIHDGKYIPGILWNLIIVKKYYDILYMVRSGERG